MISIQDILQQRLQAYKDNPLEAEKKRGKDYNKKWNDAVEYFRQRINKDQTKAKKPHYEFMAIRQRLVLLKEIDDMRTFYGKCVEYSYTKDKKTGKRNTFARGFWGATKVR